MSHDKRPESEFVSNLADDILRLKYKDCRPILRKTAVKLAQKIEDEIEKDCEWKHPVTEGI